MESQGPCASAARGLAPSPSCFLSPCADCCPWDAACLVAAGFYLLFFQLEGLHLAHPCGGASAQPSALAPSESSACGDSDASEVSDEEEVSLSEDASTEDASTVVSEEEEVVQQGAAASVLQGASASARAQRPAGVLAALLQPAAQLLAFQRQARVERRRAAAAASRKAQ